MAAEIILPKRSPQSKNNNPYIETACRDCGARQMRRKDVVKNWSGLCRKCSSKISNSNPKTMPQRIASRAKTISEWSNERKAARTEALRQQVLRQGGIPNRAKFVKEGEEGRRMAGSNHYAWKGGITPATLRERNSGRSREWRKAILQRDNYTCQFCGKRGGKLEADHIKPWSTHPELRYELSNGRTLCKPCHQTTETYKGRMYTYRKNLEDIPSF